MISERLQRLKYVIGDYVSSNAAWLIYSCLRYQLGFVSGSYHSLGAFLCSPMVLLGQVMFPLLMMGVYYLSGYYDEVFRKSRMQELFVTFCSVVVNTLLIFLIAIINDLTGDRDAGYEMILLLAAVLMALVYGVRVCITTHAAKRIKSRQWSFPTMIIGCGASATAFVEKLNTSRKATGYKPVGYVSLPGENNVKQPGLLTYEMSELSEVCKQLGVKELIVVPTKSDRQITLETINSLYSLGLPIKVTADRYNMLMSRAKISSFEGDPLVDVSSSGMSAAGQKIKRLIDIVLSVIMLLILIPFFLLIALIIVIDSRGPVFYKQERIGYRNRPFKILKFRSMVKDAEQPGQPQLSNEKDARVTRFGKVMRRFRIDELPQFFNVLRGEMSIVGPRPERQYFIDQIMERVPAYAILHSVRPGITSLGMVKYGYASNIDQMVERVNYDLLYIENMSLLNDAKIMMYTIKIVFLGRGV